VLVFLDECVQRCLKTHYRYLEASRRLRAEHSQSSSSLTARDAGSDDTDLAASPLLSTIAEQLSIRLRKGLLDAPSASASARGHAERTALLAFVNRLMLGLIGVGRPASPLLALAADLREAAADDAAGCPPVLFLADVTVSRLEAIASGPREHGLRPSTLAGESGAIRLGRRAGRISKRSGNVLGRPVHDDHANKMSST
jgi:nucleolar pre-ribosomal-associated protein 1